MNLKLKAIKMIMKQAKHHSKCSCLFCRALKVQRKHQRKVMAKINTKKEVINYE